MIGISGRSKGTTPASPEVVVGKLQEGFKVQPIDVENEMDIKARLAATDEFLATFSLPPQTQKTQRVPKDQQVNA